MTRGARQHGTFPSSWWTEHTVDAAHLLRDHDHAGRPRRVADARDREEVGQAREVRHTARELQLLLVQHVRVVQIAGGDDRVHPQLEEALERLRVPVLLHQPARRLRAEPDEEDFVRNRQRSI
jgi:hypothetical protein